MTDSALLRRLADAEKKIPPEVADYDTAVDYLERRMMGDIERELRATYNASMSGDRREQMKAVAVGLVERFIAETATLYNRPVERVLFGAGGEKDEEATERLADALRFIGYDLAMQQIERYEALLGSCGWWAQIKRERVRVVPVLPQRIVPLPPVDLAGFDPLDQEDYEAWEVRLGEDRRALIGEQEIETYERGLSVSSGSASTASPHGFSRAPFAVISATPSSDFVIPGNDVPIVRAVRDVCTYLSSLFDTVRFQGYAIPILTLIDKATAPTNRPIGVRFPLALNAGESATFATPNVPYRDLVETLQAFVSMQAIAQRSSPSEFALSGEGSPQSGFAKLIASLPKIEKRAERAERFRMIEEQRLWPILAEGLVKTGAIPASDAALRLAVTYGKLDVPESADERVRLEEHEIKHGLASAAEILARRRGISLEEAEQIVEANLETNKANAPEPKPSGFGGGLDAIVAGRRRG